MYLAGIIGLALILRVIELDAQPLWWDEGYSVFFATRDFGTLLARTAIDIHPPLYYLLLQTWMLAFGKSAFALRLLSVVIGVAAVTLLYLVARELFNQRVALISAFLLAVSPLAIYYSQELRMYGLVTLLALASVYFQLRALTNDERRTANTGSTSWVRRHLSLVLYVVFTSLALYTQYFAIFLIAAQVAIVFYLKYRARWKIEWRVWLIAWAAMAALYLPWVIYAGPKLVAYVTAKVGIEQYARLDPFTYLVQHVTAFSVGHVSEWTWLVWGSVFFAALALVGFFASRRYQVGEGNSQFAIRSSLSAIYFFVPLALGFLVNLIYTFHPIRYERLLLFAAPFFLIYVACGIIALWERERALGVFAGAGVVVLCALSLYDFYTVARYPDEDYRSLIQEMERIAAPNDLVYAIYPWQVGYLETYYQGAPLNVYEVNSDAWIENPNAMNAALTELRAANPRAWILAYQKQGRILEDRLTNEYINDYVIFDQSFGNTRLEYFTQGSETDFELAPIAFSPDLTLRIQYASFEPQSRPDLALARFAWNAPSDAYAYSLRVVDAQGNKIAQQDAPIPNGATTFKRALALPKNLASGEYTLQLVAYRRSDALPLPLQNGSRAVTLAKITIAP